MKELNSKLANVLAHNRRAEKELPQLHAKLEGEKKKYEQDLKTQRKLHESDVKALKSKCKFFLKWFVVQIDSWCFSRSLRARDDQFSQWSGAF